MNVNDFHEELINRQSRLMVSVRIHPIDRRALLVSVALLTERVRPQVHTRPEEYAHAAHARGDSPPRALAHQHAHARAAARPHPPRTAPGFLSGGSEGSGQVFIGSGCFCIAFQSFQELKRQVPKQSWNCLQASGVRRPSVNVPHVFLRSTLQASSPAPNARVPAAVRPHGDPWAGPGQCAAAPQR